MSLDKKSLRFSKNLPKVDREEYSFILTDDNGSKYYYTNNNLHRLDGPAIEAFNGDKEWYYQGVIHRFNGPAVVLSNGTKVWWKFGKISRRSGPAVLKSNGDKEWWVEGEKIAVQSKIKISKQLKRMGIEEKNIIQGKRNR